MVSFRQTEVPIHAFVCAFDLNDWRVSIYLYKHREVMTVTPPQKVRKRETLHDSYILQGPHTFCSKQPFQHIAWITMTVAGA